MEYWDPDPIIPVLHLLPYAAKSGDDLETFARFGDTLRSSRSGVSAHTAEFLVMSPNHSKLLGDVRAIRGHSALLTKWRLGPHGGVSRAISSATNRYCTQY